MIYLILNFDSSRFLVQFYGYREDKKGDQQTKV